MSDQKETLDNIRSENTATPVTQEEVAYKLFRLFTKGNRWLEDPQSGLVLFANCMLAVRDPQEFVERVKPDHINPLPD